MRLASFLIGSFALATVAGAQDVPLGGLCVGLAVNPVTQRAYLVCQPSTLLEYDVATGAQRSTAIPIASVSGTRPLVDPIQNRIYVTGAPATVVVEGSDLSVRSAPVTGATALDPGRDTAWIRTASGVTRLRGSDLHLDPVAIAGVGIEDVAVDPVLDLVYFGDHGAVIHEVDGATLATRSAPIADIASFRGLAVDPVTRRLYASVFDTFGESALQSIDAVTLGALDRVPGLSSEIAGPVATEPADGRVWMLSGSESIPKIVELHDGDDLARIATNEAHTQWLGAWTVNPATGRMHAVIGPVFGPGAIETLDAEPLTSPTYPPLPFGVPGAIGVNLATNQVVATSQDIDTADTTLSVRGEGESAPVPILTMITNEMPQPDGTVVIHFSATTGWPLPVRQIYWQVDAIDGPWSPAAPAGASGTATLDLAPGTHQVHAFAVDGQEATLGSLQWANPIVGPVASREIVVPAPPFGAELALALLGLGAYQRGRLGGA